MVVIFHPPRTRFYQLPRLGIFLFSSVQHAHRKGIIHRDLAAADRPPLKGPAGSLLQDFDEMRETELTGVVEGGLAVGVSGFRIGSGFEQELDDTGEVFMHLLDI